MKEKDKPPIIAEYEAKQALKKAAAEAMAAREKPKYTPDQALNDGEFQAFLAAQPDHETLDINDEKVLAEKREIFEKKEVVKTKLRDLCQEKFENDFGIKWSEAQQNLVETDIETKASQDPKSLLELAEKFDRAEKLPKEIEGMEALLAELGNEAGLKERLAKLKVQRKNLEIVDPYHKGGPLKFFAEDLNLKSRKVYGFLTSFLPGMQFKKSWKKETRKLEANVNKVSDADNALANDQEFAARFGEVRDFNIDEIMETIDADIAQVKSSMRAMKSAESVKKIRESAFVETRKDLVNSVAGMKEMVEIIQSRASRELKSLLDEGSTKSIDEAHDRLLFLQDAAETNELGIDPLADIDVKKFEERLETALDEAAHREVMEAVNGAKLGHGALTRLEEALEPLLARGSIVDFEDARDTVVEALEESLAMLVGKPGDPAKRLLVKRILVKLANRKK